MFFLLPLIMQAVAKAAAAGAKRSAQLGTRPQDVEGFNKLAQAASAAGMITGAMSGGAEGTAKDAVTPKANINAAPTTSVNTAPTTASTIAPTNINAAPATPQSFPGYEDIASGETFSKNIAAKPKGSLVPKFNFGESTLGKIGSNVVNAASQLLPGYGILSQTGVMPKGGLAGVDLAKIAPPDRDVLPETGAVGIENTDKVGDVDTITPKQMTAEDVMKQIKKPGMGETIARGISSVSPRLGKMTDAFFSEAASDRNLHNELLMNQYRQSADEASKLRLGEVEFERRKREKDEDRTYNEKLSEKTRLTNSEEKLAEERSAMQKIIDRVNPNVLNNIAAKYNININTIEGQEEAAKLALEAMKIANEGEAGRLNARAAADATANAKINAVNLDKASGIEGSELFNPNSPEGKAAIAEILAQRAAALAKAQAERASTLAAAQDFPAIAKFERVAQQTKTGVDPEVTAMQQRENLRATDQSIKSSVLQGKIAQQKMAMEIADALYPKPTFQDFGNGLKIDPISGKVWTSELNQYGQATGRITSPSVNTDVTSQAMRRKAALEKLNTGAPADVPATQSGFDTTKPGNITFENAPTLTPKSLEVPEQVEVQPSLQSNVQPIPKSNSVYMNEGIMGLLKNILWNPNNVNIRQPVTLGNNVSLQNQSIPAEANIVPKRVRQGLPAIRYNTPLQGYEPIF